MAIPAEITALPRAVRRVVEDLLDGGAELPMLPTVAREVLALCEAEEVDAAKLSNVLHRDPSLAAHVLRVANSPLYMGSVAIASLQQAVSRLGMAALSEIALAAAVQGKLFDRPDAQEVMRSLWRHSLAAGCFGKEIARTRRRNVESAFLCGLLHDVGKPIVLSALLDQRETVGVELTAPVLHAAMDEYHNDVGGALALAWQMPPAIEEGIRFHHDDYDQAPTSAEAAMTTCLGDHLANLVLPTRGRALEEREVRDLPVLEALNLYPDELDALIGLGESIRERVEVIG